MCKSIYILDLSDTSRVKGEGEIDGQDYHFVARPLFDEYISAKRFVEHGEYDKQYYGTSLDAVRTVINSGKICVLNLQPLSLQILHESDLKPYVVFLTPPTLQTYRQQRAKYGDPCKVCSYLQSYIPYRAVVRFSNMGGLIVIDCLFLFLSFFLKPQILGVLKHPQHPL